MVNLSGESWCTIEVRLVRLQDLKAGHVNHLLITYNNYIFKLSLLLLCTCIIHFSIVYLIFFTNM